MLCYRIQPHVLPVHYWTNKELQSLVTTTKCKVIDTFTFTYYKSESKVKYEHISDFEKRFGLSLEDFFNTPISQGIVCTI